MESNTTPRLMMIGLDGATFEVIKPLIEMGKLPNLARIMNEGASGILNSIVPPITGPAWSVLATGQNPGKLGTFDFINRRSVDDYRLYPIRSQAIAGQTFWDILAANDHKVGVLNYPMLVPAYPVDGWMISGLGASKLHHIAYPEDLKTEIDKICGVYEINLSYGLPKYQNNLPLLLKEMQDMLSNRLKVLEQMLDTRPVDVLVAVFSIPDVSQHTMWKYWSDEWHKDEVDNNDATEMREAFISLWEQIDFTTGAILERLSPDGSAVIISDHGFGPSYGVFHINEWLNETGFLIRTENLASGLNKLRQWFVEKTTPVLRPVYRWLIGSKAQQLLRASILRELDLDNTKAFALENSDGYAGIYINRQYAKHHSLDEVDFVTETSEKLKEELIRWGQANNMQMQVYFNHELYHGDFTELAPDVIVMVEQGRSSVSYRMNEPAYDHRLHHPLKSGSHRMEGIFMATGKHIAAGTQAKNAQLQDIAPTLLALAGIPVPSVIDGRVLKEVLDPALKIVHSQNDGESDLPQVEIGEQEDEDEAIILQRLADLGYID